MRLDFISSDKGVIGLMDEHDVIRKIGRFPDRIDPKPEERIKSKVWRCAKCGALHYFSEETTVPAYSCSCGSRFWMKVTGK